MNDLNAALSIHQPADHVRLRYKQWNTLDKSVTSHDQDSEQLNNSNVGALSIELKNLYTRWNPLALELNLELYKLRDITTLDMYTTNGCRGVFEGILEYCISTSRMTLRDLRKAIARVGCTPPDI